MGWSLTSNKPLRSFIWQSSYAFWLYALACTIYSPSHQITPLSARRVSSIKHAAYIPIFNWDQKACHVSHLQSRTQSLVIHYILWHWKSELLRIQSIHHFDSIAYAFYCLICQIVLRQIHGILAKLRNAKRLEDNHNRHNNPRCQQITVPYLFR